MKPETTIDDVGGGMLVVEAPSVEDALAAVAEQIGPEGTIISAEKVSRGGVGGFFAKEIYRVSFQTTPQDAPAPLIDVRAVVDNAAALAAADDQVLDLRDGVDAHTPAAVDRVLQWEEPAAPPVPATSPAPSTATAPSTFGEALRAQLEARNETATMRTAPAPVATPAPAAPGPTASAPAPAAVVATPTTPPTGTPAGDLPSVAPRRQQAATAAYAAPARVAVDTAPATVDTAPSATARAGRNALAHSPAGTIPGTGSVKWNADALSRLGLPFSLIQPLADLDASDDLGWVYRLSELLAPLCGGLPTTATLLVGRRMNVLAQALGVRVLEASSAMTADVSALETDLTRPSLPFIDTARGDRGLHVFCGAPIESTPQHVELISFDEDHLGAALHLALATGAPLGYCVRGDDLVHVTPFELALSVRSRLQRV